MARGPGTFGLMVGLGVGVGVALGRGFVLVGGLGLFGPPEPAAPWALPPAPPVALTGEQCAAPPTPTLPRWECVTDEIGCGETRIGTTRGGTSRYDSRFYGVNFCAPATTDRDGGDERVYRVRVPDEDWTVLVTLDTPCADLDVAALLWSGPDCPPAANLGTRCDMATQSASDRERLHLVTQHAGYWYLVVEGKGDEEGAFALTVQCVPGFGR